MPVSQKYIHITEKEMPGAWYNIQADLPTPLKPPLHPVTKKPISFSDLSPIFSNALIAQETSTERWINIPDAVRDLYVLWRPSPLVRAYNLEKFLDTPARIYYKYEGVSPTGSHKPNSAVAQAYYNKIEGVERIATETGAGQWGSSLAFACNHFGIACQVFMVKVSYHQKPYRKNMMEIFNASVIASPSTQTEAGRKILEADPDSPGSLGIAISEAVEVTLNDDRTKYSLGSVLNSVVLHQTIIGLEAERQFEVADDYPDILIGPFGGGSNFAGFTFPFLRHKINGQTKVRVIAVEPTTCPTLTRGKFAYDYGDALGLTPLMPMLTLGHKFIPDPVHAGGLRYHGASPLVSQLYADGFIEAVAYRQKECFKSAIEFAQVEGIIPAPEASHAIHAAIQEALKCKESGEKKVICFNLSGHGHLDLSAYEAFLAGHLEDTELNEKNLEKSFSQLIQV